MSDDFDADDFDRLLSEGVEWLSQQAYKALNDGHSDLPMERLHSAQEMVGRMQRALRMIEASEGSETLVANVNQTVKRQVPVVESCDSSSIKPIESQPSALAQHTPRKRHKPDPAFDFLILDTVQVCEGKGSLCSKDLIFQVVHKYDPTRKESVLGPKLNTWNCDGDGKGWLDWVSGDTSEIRITDLGREQRSKLRRRAKERAAEKIEIAIRAVIDDSYSFPDG